MLSPFTTYFIEPVGVETGLAQFVQLKPLEGVHVYWDAPVTDNWAVLPKQTFISLLATTEGVGCTVILNVFTAPGQRLVEGVTVMTAVIGVLLLLTAVKPGIFPVPLADNPIEGLLFVQV